MSLCREAGWGDAEIKYCTKCGEELEDDAEYCSRCGQPVKRKLIAREEEQTWATVKPTQAAKPEGTSHVADLGLLLSVAALVMALAALVMALPAVLPVANIALSFMGAAVGVAGMQRDRNEGIVATVIGIIAGIINAIWLTFYFYESMQMPL